MLFPTFELEGLEVGRGEFHVSIAFYAIYIISNIFRNKIHRGEETWILISKNIQNPISFLCHFQYFRTKIREGGWVFLSKTNPSFHVFFTFYDISHVFRTICFWGRGLDTDKRTGGREGRVLASDSVGRRSLATELLCYHYDDEG